MPDRIIRNGIITSEAVNQLGWAEEVFYRRLLSVVDDHGLFDGRNSILRSSLYPLQLNLVRESDIETWKRCAAKAGLVRPYSVDGKQFVQVLKFGQRVRGKPRWPIPEDYDWRAAVEHSRRTAASCGDPPPNANANANANANIVFSDSGDAPQGGRQEEKVRPVGKKAREFALTVSKAAKKGERP